MSEATVNIVGVGNTLMGDDGAGPAAVEALRRCALPPGVELIDAGLAVSDVLGGLDPASPLIVVDALRAGGAPGTVYRLRLTEGTIDGAPVCGCVSLHELSVMPALAMEAMAGRPFRDVTVYGIEPEKLSWGEGLSPPVAAAVERVARVLAEHLGAMAVGVLAGDHKA